LLFQKNLNHLYCWFENLPLESFYNYVFKF
jgi:hypothetical protein